MPVNHLLPLLVASTVFERFNVFIEPLDFSLKLSLILLPIVGITLLARKKLTFNPTVLFPFLAVLIFAEALSIAASYDRLQSLQVVFLHLLMVGLFYLVVWASSLREKIFNLIVKGWGVGALVVSTLGFWQFGRYLAGLSPVVFLDDILGAKRLSADTFVQTFWGRSFLRPSSTFIDTNTAASFAGISILLSLGFLLASRKKRDRPFFTSVAVFSFLFFAMALSRSAVLGLALGLSTFAVVNLWGRIGRKALTRAAAIFAAFVILALACFTIAQPERLLSSLDRVDYLRGAIEMFRRNPILGIGAGNFEPYYTEVIAPDEPFGFSHSILLTWVGELGVLGLAANVLLVAVLVFVLGREALRHPFGSAWRIRMSALLAAFIALLGANIFHAHYGLEFTWVLMGLCVSGLYLAKRQRSEPTDILGVRVDAVTMVEAIDRVKSFFKTGKKSAVFTPNPEMVMMAVRAPSFRKVLDGADLATPDGSGIVWASRILGTPVKERVAGADLFLELCAEAARRGGRIFLLGAREGVAERAARNLRRRYPKLKVAGTFAGDGSPRGDKKTIAAVKAVAGEIDFLFVAYGGGKEERWIIRNLGKVPVKVAMGVGGTFDFIAGEVSRAPRIVRCLGLEWLYRLIREPKRLKRQLVLIPFATRVFKQSLRS